MADYFLLDREHASCWYEIGFNKKKPAILANVHRDFLKFLPSLKGSPMVDYFMEEFGFSNFSYDIANSHFGFNDTFQRVGEKDSFINFSIEIPVWEKELMRCCSLCQGNKKDLLFGGDCVNCRATGQEKKIIICQDCKGEKKDAFGDDCRNCKGEGKMVETLLDFDACYVVSATFSIFFTLMSFGQNKDHAVISQKPQLILIDTTTQKSTHGGSLCGRYSVPLVNWLSAFKPNTSLRKMENAMLITHKRVFGSKSSDYDHHSIWAKVAYENGWLNVNIPGSACGLHPACSMGIEKGLGYQFSCHNVDSPMQQLTLLAGLGALCDQARQEIKV